MIRRAAPAAASAHADSFEISTMARRDDIHTEGPCPIRTTFSRRSLEGSADSLAAVAWPPSRPARTGRIRRSPSHRRSAERDSRWSRAGTPNTRTPSGSDSRRRSSRDSRSAGASVKMSSPHPRRAAKCASFSQRRAPAACPGGKCRLRSTRRPRGVSQRRVAKNSPPSVARSTDTGRSPPFSQRPDFPARARSGWRIPRLSQWNERLSGWTHGPRGGTQGEGRTASQS